MYGFPLLQLTVVNITNNTDTTINDISFNYEESMSEDVVISTLKPDAINPGIAVKYSGILHIGINDVKDNGKLQLSVTIEE